MDKILLILTLVLGIFTFIKIVFSCIIVLTRVRNNELVRKENIPLSEIDIIVPAFNEEKVILRTINNLLEINYDSFNIYVVNDGSTDDTLCLLDYHFKGNKKVVIITKVNEGKAKALNRALLLSKSELIFFVDADTHVKPDILNTINSCFFQNDTAAIAGHLVVRNTTNLLTVGQNIEYLTSLNLEREILEKVNLFTTIPGATCAFRRKDLERIGYFNSCMATEDCDITFRLLKAGLKIKNAKNVVGYTEAPSSSKMFIRQRIRWNFGLIQNLLEHMSYVSEKKSLIKTQIWLILSYHWLYKIIYKILFALIDLIFLVSLFGGFQRVHCFYIYFIIMESLLSVIIMIKEMKTSMVKLPIILFYRILYRQLLFVSLATAVAKLLLGYKDVWQKVKRTDT